MKNLLLFIYASIFVLGFCLAISDGKLFPVPNFIGIITVWISVRLLARLDVNEYL